MRKFFVWLGPARLPFLVLTPACILLGVACVQWTRGQVHLQDALLVLLGAAAAHISVNAFNEYLDFRSGLDAMTRRTPFSGGSGVLPLGLAGVALALPTVRAVLANALDVNRLLPAMRRNVLICIQTPVLMAIGILM